jgi:hypothetical protein
MTHSQAEQFKNELWFVKITCPEVGVYVVHAQSWLVDCCVHQFTSYAELRAWAATY